MNNQLARVGTVGRYQTIEELGRGAMGIVYKGYDPVINRYVALKTIAFSDNDADTREFRRRLYSEASAAGALAHPNIVTIYDIVEQEGITAVAMEFVEGRTLSALIAAEAPLDSARALTLFEPICAALDYAAERGIVHRDIKPANILVGVDARPRIADFGIARLPNAHVTMTGVIMGSPGYMSPEQVRGDPLDRRSDLFSAAAVFYEMITGQRPFAAADSHTTLYRIVHEPHVPAHRVNAAVDPAVAAVVDRALAKDRNQRFESGAALVAALRRSGTVAQTAPTYVLPAAGSTAAISTPAPRRAALVTGIVGLLVTIAATGFVAWKSLVKPGSTPSSAGAATVSAPAAPAQAPVTAVDAAKPAPAAASPAPRQDAARRAEAGEPVTRAPRGTADARPPAVAANRSIATTPVAPPSAARLDVGFDGEPFPVTIYAGPVTLGRLDSAGPVPAPSGEAHVRAVSEAVFLDRDFGAMATRPGEHRALQLPGLGSAVISVKDEVYSGVRIFVDDRALPGPYPAQISRIAAGVHTVRVAWITGPRNGRELRQDVDVRPGGHLLIRAVPDAEQILVQATR